MKRKTLDAILLAGGALTTAVLVLAGVLLVVGSNYATTSVRDQLQAQHITFPAAGSPALSSDQIGPYLNQFAGQEMTTGDQAEAYADHFIAVHLQELAKGQTYIDVSTQLQTAKAQLQQAPNDRRLASEVSDLQSQQQTLFQGDTLRGLLLEAYGFAQFGKIAAWAAVAAFIAAGAMLILTILGVLHWRKVSPDAMV